MGKLFVGGPNREKKYTISGIKLAIKMAKTLLKKNQKITQEQPELAAHSF